MNKAAQPHYCKLDTKMPGKKSSSTAGKKTKGGKSKSNAAAAVVSQAAQSALVRAAVPQWFRIDPDQIQGAAGGFVWKISDKEQTIRYLIIGSEGGNFYQTPQQVSSTCASCILRLTRTPDNFKWLCDTIRQVSAEGRAAKQESTLIALATIIVFAPTMEAKKQALDIVNDCVRIPTHLYMLTGYVKLFSKAGHPKLIAAGTAGAGGQTQQPVTGSGFGRGIRRVFGDYFYTRKGSEIAMLMTKYQNREGWRIKDVLTLVHIDQKKMKDDEGRLAIDWVFKPKEEFEEILKAAPPSPTAALFNAIKEISGMVESPTFRSSQEELTRIIERINSAGLCREHLPSQLFKQRRIWEALLMNKGVSGKGKGMPLTALIRNLGKLSTTEIGIIEARTTRDTNPNAKIAYAGARLATATAAAESTPQVFPLGHSQHYTEYIYRRLTNARDIKGARIHPYNVLVAMLTYKKGCGDKGGLTWTPNIYILEALDIAFKLAFQNITPTGKRIKIALDVSGSMSSAFCTGSPIVNCATGSVAMMMMTLWVENQHRLKLATTPASTTPAAESTPAATASASQHLAEVMKWKITQLPDGRTLYEHAETKQCQFNKPEILSAPQPQQQTPKAAGGAATAPATAPTTAPTLGEYKATKRYLGIPEEAPKQPERQGQFGYSSYYSSSYTPPPAYLPEIYPAPAIPSNVTICAFSNTLTELTNAIVGYMDASINPETGLPMMSIDDALKLVEMPFSSTDCALPMVRALENREPVDAFVIYTDSETYMGKIHPQVALEEYRRGMGINAKLIVVGMTSNCLTIADPNDLNTLNLAGFDTATPRIINDFITGTLLPTPAPKPAAAQGGAAAAAAANQKSGGDNDGSEDDEEFVLLD